MERDLTFENPLVYEILKALYSDFAKCLTWSVCKECLPLESLETPILIPRPVSH